MGLFGSKEHCPLCGQPIKGMLNVKLKDKVSLCKECGYKICMDPSKLPFQTVEDIKKHILYREENQKLFNSFSPTNEIVCGPAYFREDSEIKKWYYTYEKNPKNPALFDYNEIIDYELTEDGEQISNGGLGAAVAGGVLFGATGAVVGSNIGKKKIKTVIKSMKLRISLSNQYISQISIEFNPLGNEIKYGSSIYKLYKQQADGTISFLDSLCSKAKNNSSPSIPSSVGSIADEILKFKNLLDSGIITQDEFDKKKQQLLNA